MMKYRVLIKSGGGGGGGFRRRNFDAPGGSFFSFVYGICEQAPMIQHPSRPSPPSRAPFHHSHLILAMNSIPASLLAVGFSSDFSLATDLNSTTKHPEKA